MGEASLATHDAWSRGIDDLVNFDFAGRGAIEHLYAAARRHYAGSTGAALSGRAANALIERLRRGDSVVLLTGFPELPWLERGVGETDGPVGAAVLARALIRSTGAIPVVPIEAHYSDVVRAAFLGVGLTTVFGDATMAARARPGDPVAILVVTEGGSGASSSLVGLEPAAIVAIERPGANECGEYHHMTGRNISHCMADLEDLFIQTGERGGLTVAIGDGGNEVGMGALSDVVRSHVSRGGDCGCGCGGGTAASSVAQHLVTATVANWGATAIAAAIAMRTGQRSDLAAPELELRSLDACAAAGAVDGAHGGSLPSVDGLPRSVYHHVIGLIGHITNKALGVEHEYS